MSYFDMFCPLIETRAKDCVPLLLPNNKVQETRCCNPPLRSTLCALTLFYPGGKRLLEVLVLLECDGGAHLGGQYHLGIGGSLTR